MASLTLSETYVDTCGTQYSNSPMDHDLFIFIFIFYAYKWSRIPIFQAHKGFQTRVPIVSSLLLVAKDLSTFIQETKRIRIIRGITLGDFECLTHLLFVNNVIFLNGSLSKGRNLKDILQLYFKSSRMERVISCYAYEFGGWSQISGIYFET